MNSLSMVYAKLLVIFFFSQQLNLNEVNWPETADFDVTAFYKKRIQKPFNF